MFNSGKKIRALRDKKNKYSNSCVLNETKNHNLPFQVKWSVPKLVISLKTRINSQNPAIIFKEN